MNRSDEGVHGRAIEGEVGCICDRNEIKESRAGYRAKQNRLLEGRADCSWERRGYRFIRNINGPWRIHTV